MADHTATEMLAAIDIVSVLPDIGRLSAVLGRARSRIEQRIKHDEAIGLAYLREHLDRDPNPEDVGAAIRKAVESTGATITEPLGVEPDDRSIEPGEQVVTE